MTFQAFRDMWQLRPSFHRTLYLMTLVSLSISMTTSVSATTVSWIVMLANWVLEMDFREKWQRFCSSRLAQASMVLLAVHLLWLIGNSTPAVGLDDIRQKLPLFIIPLVVLTSRPIARRHLLCIAGTYLAAVVVMTVIGLGRYLAIDHLPHRSIIPTISHIRFGLHLCFSICLAIYLCVRLRPLLGGRMRRRLVWTTVLLTLWLFFFIILLLQSYTALLILMVLVVTLSPVILRRTDHLALRRVVVTALVATVTATVWIVIHFVNEYYGNCDRGADMVEAGSYIYRDVDSPSMSAGWMALTGGSLADTTASGYTVSSTLVRYLNATHRSKDSAGVVSLTPDDVETVRRGVANPIYLARFSPRAMVYKMLFEYENYRRGASVKDFSMLERLELWRSAWHVFLAHPVWGVGTGDVVAVCHQQLEYEKSELAGTKKDSHSQYLFFLVAFGCVGSLLLLFFYGRAVLTTPSLRSPLALSFLVILFVSFVNETTLTTQAGCLFAAFPWVMVSLIPVDQPVGQIPSLKTLDLLRWLNPWQKS